MLLHETLNLREAAIVDRFEPDAELVCGPPAG
jgi:hypothetical protein